MGPAGEERARPERDAHGADQFSATRAAAARPRPQPRAARRVLERGAVLRSVVLLHRAAKRRGVTSTPYFELAKLHETHSIENSISENHLEHHFLYERCSPEARMSRALASAGVKRFKVEEPAPELLSAVASFIRARETPPQGSPPLRRAFAAGCRSANLRPSMHENIEKRVCPDVLAALGRIRIIMWPWAGLELSSHRLPDDNSSLAPFLYPCKEPFGKHELKN